MKDEPDFQSQNSQLILNNPEQKAIDRVFTKKRSRENYCKLTVKKSEILENWFKRIRYPTKEEYEAIASEINENVAKIENWFKHKRRKIMIEGNLNLYKRRRLLTEDEKAILEETFRDTMHPNKPKLHELAKTLKFSTKVISNWFSYRRKKFLRVQCYQATFPKNQPKAKKIKQNSSQDAGSSPSIQLNGSRSGSDFSLNLKRGNQPNTNCTGPSDSQTGGQNSNNKSEENTNENEQNERPKKKLCEESKRFNSENFQAQDHDGNLGNCQSFGNFFIKNNNIMPTLIPARQNVNVLPNMNVLPYGYTTTQNNSRNSVPGNRIQNYCPLNINNSLQFQNYPNSNIYAPVMLLGQDCLLVPVVHQPYVMGYPSTTPSVFMPNVFQGNNNGNQVMNFVQPVMNNNRLFMNTSNNASDFGLNMNSAMGINKEKPSSDNN